MIIRLFDSATVCLSRARGYSVGKGFGDPHRQEGLCSAESRRRQKQQDRTPDLTLRDSREGWARGGSPSFVFFGVALSWGKESTPERHAPAYFCFGAAGRPSGGRAGRRGRRARWGAAGVSNWRYLFGGPNPTMSSIPPTRSAFGFRIACTGIPMATSSNGIP